MHGRPTLLVILLAVAAAGFWVGARGMRSEPPHALAEDPLPRLVVDDVDLLFGKPWAQRDFQWTLPVRNVSAFDVEVVEWEPSCGACSSVEPKSLVVPAGETRDVTVTLDLTKRRPVEADVASYPFAVLLRPIVKLRNGGGAVQVRRLEWQLSGDVRNFVTVEPPVVLLGERSVLAGAFPEQTVRLSFLQPVDEVTVETPSDVVANVSRVAPDSPEFELRVQTHQLAIGAVQRQVLVRAMDASGEALPPVMVAVSGVIVPDVEVVPAAVTFGIRKQGESAVETVTLRSRSGRDFRVEDIETTANSLRIAKNGDQTFAYALIQEIEDIGFQSTSITFHVVHEAGPHSEAILVPVRYVGADAENGQAGERTD